MARRATEFDRFMRELEAEAKARGELALLAAYRRHFRSAQRRKRAPFAMPERRGRA